MPQRKLSNAWKSKCLLALVGIGMNVTLPGNVAKAEVTSSCWITKQFSAGQATSCCLGWSRTRTPKEVCDAVRANADGLKVEAHDSQSSFDSCTRWSGCSWGRGDPKEIRDTHTVRQFQEINRPTGALNHHNHQNPSPV